MGDTGKCQKNKTKIYALHEKVKKWYLLSSDAYFRTGKIFLKKEAITIMWQC